jgi:hypothetical protein
MSVGSFHNLLVLVALRITYNTQLQFSTIGSLISHHNFCFIFLLLYFLIYLFYKYGLFSTALNFSIFTMSSCTTTDIQRWQRSNEIWNPIIDNLYINISMIYTIDNYIYCLWSHYSRNLWSYVNVCGKSVDLNTWVSLGFAVYDTWYGFCICVASLCEKVMHL